ncbi:MAG: hypothetical protein BM557_02005 [Flavobacterium sp. MedPE-SWcel]|uniref:hypothetical protein n=1 Tax=uncultured Flavobacterium sp. TaxID=165435 RepID=UPI0009217308|nr:hypothetical protein [uncultured Flavobacterium sp.]OIQ22171.1 MAG: hypothetical protein BM557_02005 [Flavobacterium sp. MedPE-SWcel]
MALNINDETYHAIRNNISLREEMAEYLGVKEMTIYQHAVRKSIVLLNINLINILMSHTGKTEKEIFDSV